MKWSPLDSVPSLEEIVQRSREETAELFAERNKILAKLVEKSRRSRDMNEQEKAVTVSDWRTSNIVDEGLAKMLRRVADSPNDESWRETFKRVADELDPPQTEQEPEAQFKEGDLVCDEDSCIRAVSAELVKWRIDGGSTISGEGPFHAASVEEVANYITECPMVGARAIVQLFKEKQESAKAEGAE